MHMQIGNHASCTCALLSSVWQGADPPAPKTKTPGRQAVLCRPPWDPLSRDVSPTLQETQADMQLTEHRMSAHAAQKKQKACRL